MASAKKGSHAPSTVQLSYQLIRNTTSPDEVATGVKSFVANLPAFEIEKLDTKANLRSYLAEYSVKKRNSVHEAIRRTIESAPLRFITRNSGFVISASGIEVDDNKKIVTLTEPSIINGAQSQGEIKKWIAETFGEEGPNGNETPFHVRAEFIIDEDAPEVVETAIARNKATKVKSISEAGARGQLDDLQKFIHQQRPDINIRTDESQEGVYDTRKILQYTRLLMPASVSGSDSPAERLRPYKNPEQCLTEFCDWSLAKETDPEAKRKYDFTVQMAVTAIEEYERWEKHEAWNGNHLWEETKGGRACRRDKANKIVWVSPGLVFPIMGAMSEFVAQDKKGKWKLAKPAVFKPAEMVQKAVALFRGLKRDPMQMGRDANVYDALRWYPKTLIEAMAEVRREVAAAS